MTLELPAGKRCAACLSFDFDAVSLWFGTFKVFTNQAIGRGEFAVRVGVERILRLLEKHQVPSTWFIPGHTAESWPALARQVVDAGHEIGHHGYCHENPLELDPEEEEAVLVRGIDCLVEATGQRPVGYRSPIWDTTESTIPLLLKHGFEYAGNGMADDFHPYRARISDVASATEPFRYGEETDILEIPSAWHLTDLLTLETVFQYPHRISAVPSEVIRIWLDEFNYMYENVAGGVITYVFHPQGIARAHRILLLERLITEIIARQDVWFARMGEVARAWND